VALGSQLTTISQRPTPFGMSILLIESILVFAK
jgi:hypothetical protein